MCITTCYDFITRKYVKDMRQIKEEKNMDIRQLTVEDRDKTGYRFSSRKYYAYSYKRIFFTMKEQ